jgi:hypothetical protein
MRRVSNGFVLSQVCGEEEEAHKVIRIRIYMLVERDGGGVYMSQ